MNSENETLRIALSDLDEPIRDWIVDVKGVLEFVVAQEFTTGIEVVDTLLKERVRDLLRMVKTT
jgi:hypothetical protein